mmetsp:Transcript_9717/g.15913  ORF Transcript_9717/g.15913 Transcript_9717/m.15913 type:complete len:714 (+) Transcript_9717:103-2244(+)
MQFSEYPEAADDSIVPVVPDDTINFPQQQLGADDVPGPTEDYDEEELRELNRRSGKGLYVMVSIIAVLAVAALAVGSTLLVQKNRSIEAAEQSANPPPPPPSPPAGASVPTPATNTYLPTFGSSFYGTTAGIGATEEDGSNGVGDSTPTASGTSGGESDSSGSSGSDGIGATDEDTGGSTSGSNTADEEVGGGNATGGNATGGGDASDSDVSDGGTLPGDLLGDVIDIIDTIDGESPTSSPGDSTTGGSAGGSTGDTGVESSANDSTNVDDSGSNGGVTDASGGSISSPGEGSTDESSVSSTGDAGEDSSAASVGTAVDECAIGGPCSQEGANCAIGQESCCGETFNSIECLCSGGEWLCWATEACMAPDCGDLNTTAPSVALPSPSPSSIGNASSTPTIVAPQATPTLVLTNITDDTSAPTASKSSASPIPSASNEPTCTTSIEVDFVTEEQGNLDQTGYTLLSTTGSRSTTYMEVLPGDLKNMTSQNDVACVTSGAYIFTVNDESSKCCGDNRGYFAVKVNGEEVVRGKSYFTSPSAYIIRTDYQPPTDLTKVQWLNKHNIVREPFHADNGVPFAPLLWSDSLAEAAAERASDIAPTCVAGSTAMDAWGENIGSTFGGYNEEYVSPDHVLGGWNNSEDNPLTFRQIMWRPTRYVGCASNITQMNRNGIYCHVAVCKYARPGNCNVNNETWLNQTLADYSKCDPPCPTEGCY